MKRWHYFIIFVIGLLVRIFVAALQESPGFMDAEYYFIGGQQLAQGNGFSEQILWNYLDDPTGIPHPSHGYWMPLTSILASIGMIIANNQSFAATQIIFILIGSLLPLLAAYLCFQLTKNCKSAFLAGGLAILPAFYLPYLTTTDTFGIYAVLGATFFILLSEKFATKRFLTPFLLGLVAGLMHLSRTDGIMWLGFALIAVLFYLVPGNQKENSKFRAVILGCILTIGGYLVIMGPWFLRNFQLFRSFLAPGGSRSFWIIDYNELFIFPASQLTFDRWLAAGFDTILQARIWALQINLQRSLAEQGMIFLTPLIILGLWHFRKDFRIKLGAFIWLCTFVVMTFVFPYQGARGGFFHSSAALLPLLWAAAAIGLNAALVWASSTRGWNIKEAGIVFTIATIFIAGLLSGFVLFNNFFGDDLDPPKWEENRIAYQQIEQAILELGANPKDIVLTTNPPGYFAYTHRPAIAIPDGDISTLLEVAEKHQGKFLVLEKDHPDGLANLYIDPKSPLVGLEYLATVNGTQIFIIE
jgi:hypothetical protein